MNSVQPRLCFCFLLICCGFGLLHNVFGETSKTVRALNRVLPMRAETAAASGSTFAPDIEDRLAWDEFASLVHPLVQGDQRKQSPPDWVAWSDKCKAGLMSSCQTLAPHQDSPVPIDASSAEFPRQVLLEFAESQSKHKEAEFVQRYTQAPQLASVLFNPQATASIHGSNLGQKSMLDLAVEQLDAGALTGADRRLPENTFEFGSTIIKLIWEIVPASVDLHLFDPTNEAVVQGSNRLANVALWNSGYFIDPDTKKPCSPVLPDYGSSQQGVTVPINCFYWFNVRGAQTCNFLSRDVTQVWCQPPLKNQDFYAILVGFHVMKLVATNPNWIWMTFYWTKDVNDVETGSGAKWAPPWNHFHEYSTTAIREEGPASHQMCFNPYLEAWGPNGLAANCLSCHSFSAYAPQGSKLQSGKALGETYPYPISQRKRDENIYFTGSIQTAFVWSVSTNQDPSTQALVSSFESAVATAILDQLKAK